MLWVGEPPNHAKYAALRAYSPPPAARSLRKLTRSKAFLGMTVNFSNCKGCKTSGDPRTAQ